MKIEVYSTFSSGSFAIVPLSPFQFIESAAIIYKIKTPLIKAGTVMF